MGPASGPTWTWRWALASLLLALAAYPLGKWVSKVRGTDPETLAAGRAALIESLDHHHFKRYEEAVEAAKRAADADQSLAAFAYNNMAVSLLELRRLEEAREAALEALRLQPDHELARNNLAWIEREMATDRTGAGSPRDQDAGPRPTADAPGLVADAPDLMTAIATASRLLSQSMQHARAGRYQECFDLATQSAKLSPNPRAFNQAARCADKLKLPDEARRNAEQAARAAPRAPTQR